MLRGTLVAQAGMAWRNDKIMVRCWVKVMIKYLTVCDSTSSHLKPIQTWESSIFYRLDWFDLLLYLIGRHQNRPYDISHSAVANLTKKNSLNRQFR